MIQQKLDRLDEAFLYSEPIDFTSYSRHRVSGTWRRLKVLKKRW